MESSNLKIAIVVGHEQRAKGAFGVDPLHEYEYDYNHELALLIATELDHHALFGQIFLRDHIGILGVGRAVNQFNPDACVELHFNAANCEAFGTETLYAMHNPMSKVLADCLQTEMVKCFERDGEGNRGVKKAVKGDRGYFNVYLPNCPSCLLEPFFGDNPNDAALGLNKKQALAQSIAEGLTAFVQSHKLT